VDGVNEISKVALVYKVDIDQEGEVVYWVGYTWNWAGLLNVNQLKNNIVAAHIRKEKLCEIQCRPNLVII
jgi:hypothetical protein